MAILSERLTQLREEKGWSKTLVAQKLGLKNMATYANYEYGTREPDIDTLKRLASLYDVTIDYLLDQNQAPKWASHDDVIDLKEMLAANVGLTFSGEGLTDADKQRVNDILTGLYWEKLHKKKKREN